MDGQLFIRNSELYDIIGVYLKDFWSFNDKIFENIGDSQIDAEI